MMFKLLRKHLTIQEIKVLIKITKEAVKMSRPLWLFIVLNKMMFFHVDEQSNHEKNV